MYLTYVACKGLAYSLLASIGSCDHNKAKALGYKDGWALLIDKHDGPEMAAFCAALPEHLSAQQRPVLLDGLAKEYANLPTWADFIDAALDWPRWKPSIETLQEFLSTHESKS